MSRPTALADLRRAVDAGQLPHRSVKRELRDNLIEKIRTGESLFPGIVGYDESVIPQLVNAILSQHNFIILGFARSGEDPHTPGTRPAARRRAPRGRWM